MSTGLALVVTVPFSLTQNTCGLSLGAGASCSVGVVFTPTANGIVQGHIDCRGLFDLNTAIVMLSGTGGLAGVVQLQPASLSFPTTGVGTTSGAQTITVTNAGMAVLTDLATDGLQRFSVGEQYVHNFAGAGSELHGRSGFCAWQRRAADRQPDGCEFCDGSKRTGAAIGNGNGLYSDAFRIVEPDGGERADCKLSHLC